MLVPATNYRDLRAGFSWQIPAHYNMGVDVCDKWADVDPGRLALVHVPAAGPVQEYSFGRLKASSNRLANVLENLGVSRGDRVAILLPQCPETAYGHIAVHKLGAISLPLFTLFGPEALEYRLRDSGACCVITDTRGVERLGGLRDSLPDLKYLLCIDGGCPGAVDLPAAMAAASKLFRPVDTPADDPALIIYTSGTTGQPKGALHAHRCLLGHLPGVEMSHDFFPQPGDRIWTPADWAWIGGLLDVLMPALHHGITVVSRRFEKFDPEAAFQLLQDFGVRNAFIPPTALKMLRTVPEPEKRWALRLRSVASGGESLGAELLDWGRRSLGVTINEFYGQTECNMVVSSAGSLEAPVAGAMGWPVPGHDVDIVDVAGQRLEDGVQGNIAVRSPDPVMFLGYWNRPEATRDKFANGWLLTGDVGYRRADGRLCFVARDDDVITSAGYRIGPGEIEDCLLRHPAVRMAAVVGKPDPLRTEIVKAYVVLNPGSQGSDALASELKEWVRDRLAAHEYPRELEFLEELPMTTTGKVIRQALRQRASRH